ncbi:hypothetical protein BHM03_00005526 [Ensete ventricosum]|nr:hypothetical protein BHM03_00005526 [Ensete ventricosum]
MNLMLVLVALLLKPAMPASGGSFEEEELYHNERNDLIQLRDSLSSAMSLHSNWTGPPCHNHRSRWLGITCFNSNVIGLALHGIQLTGSLPSTALQNVSQLASLNFSDNALHGNLPSLQGLVHLRAVSFARNRFSGSIPSEFVALPNLARLELQDNVLSGAVPPFDQRTMAVFNVSYNFLEGSIPNTSVMQGFPSTAFDHNTQLCGRPLAKPCPTAPPPPPLVSPVPPLGRAGGARSPPATSSSSKTLRPWILVLVAIVAATIAFMVIFCFLYYSKRYSKKAKQTAHVPGIALQPSQSKFWSVFYLTEESITAMTVKEAKSSESVAEPKKVVDLMFLDKQKATFDLDDLLSSSAEVMGKGLLGSTYKATLGSGAVVAVKRLKTMHGMSKKEFAHQMQLLGKLRHENLVDIISFHYSKEEKLVVYEYVPGGSLFQLLHGNHSSPTLSPKEQKLIHGFVVVDNRGEARVPLKWAARLNIVQGIARGLAYLHQCMPSYRVPHANLKSSNVLILRRSMNYYSKLTDYGFHYLLPSSHSHRLAIGKAPEFCHGKKLALKADVYCFGLVLLEVITGHAAGDGEEDLPGWVKLVVNNDWSTDILDLEIVAEKESHGDMLKLTEIALHCTELEPERRPTMSDVVRRIEEIRGTSSGRR